MTRKIMSITHREELIPQIPTPKAAEFTKANAKSGVISGAVFAGGGGNYTLADGRSFDLSLADMRSMPMPKWDFDK
jgi:hypothetical protein